MSTYRRILSSAKLPCLCDVTKAIDAFSLTRTISPLSLFMFDTKKYSQVSAFSRLVSLMEQRTDKILGSRGVYPKKIFATDLHELKKQLKSKVGRQEGVAPPGGATESIIFQKA